MSVLAFFLTAIIVTVLGAVQAFWTAWVVGKLWEMFLLPVGPLPSFWVLAGAILVVGLLTRQYTPIPEEERVQAFLIQDFLVPTLALTVGGFMTLFW